MSKPAESRAGTHPITVSSKIEPEMAIMDDVDDSMA